MKSNRYCPWQFLFGKSYKFSTMSFNNLWYPEDFAGRDLEPTVADAIDLLNQDGIAQSINELFKNRQIYQDIVSIQNQDAYTEDARIPFFQVGALEVAPPAPSPTPDPQPTILVTPMDFRSIDVEEGSGEIGQTVRILITALNDDLTIYGILTTEHAYWTINPADGVVANHHDPDHPDYDPKVEVLDLDSFPITIPQNTWKAFFITLDPREGTISETEPFFTIGIAFILSNATNLSTNTPEADYFHNEIVQYPEYAGTPREYFNNFIAVRASGTIIPKLNPDPPEPDTRIFPPAAPIPSVDNFAPLPPELRYGSRGYLVGGNNLLEYRFNRKITKLNLNAETLTTAQNMSAVREWPGVVGNSTQFYIVGGSRADKSINTHLIDSYNFITDSLVRISAGLDVQSDMLSGAPSERKGYLFGGDSDRWLDPNGPTFRYGTLNRIRLLDYDTEQISTIGTTLAQEKGLVNCATGNKRYIWLFGGGARNVTSLNYEFYAHTPVLNIEKFTVTDQSVQVIGTQLASDNAWRNCSCGNRDNIYIAGGNDGIGGNKRTPYSSGSLSNTISRFNIADEVLLNIGQSLLGNYDGLAPMGGSKKIYYGGGFNGTNNGSLNIQKLQNIEGLNNETITLLSTQLTTSHNGAGGISDYNAGFIS